MIFKQQNSALHFLPEGAPMVFEALPECGQGMIRDVQEIFPPMRPAFRRRIRCMSVPLMDAYRQALSRLKGNLPREPVVESGTWILPITGQQYHTVFYDLSLTPDTSGKLSGSVNLFYFLSLSTARTPYLSYVVSSRADGRSVISEETLDRFRLRPEDLAEEIVSLILFTRYCDLETMIVVPGNRYVRGQEEYQNSGAFTIEMLDSDWFTNLVRSEGFRVGAEKGGFFRLQRHGPGRQEHKLIWVHSDGKCGDDRRAKIQRVDSR